MPVTRHPVAFAVGDITRARLLLREHGRLCYDAPAANGRLMFDPADPRAAGLDLRLFEAHGPARDDPSVRDCVHFWAPDPGIAAYLAACRLARVETLADVTATLGPQEPAR